MSSPTLGLIIRQRRVELGLTQEELAERVGNGVRQAEISRLEHDRVALPRRKRLEQIATALEIPVGTLLARSGWAGAQEEFGRIENDMPASASHAVVPPATKALHLDLIPESMLLGPELSPDLFSAIARSQEIIKQSRAIMHEARLSYDHPSCSHSVVRKEKSLSRKPPDTPC